MRSVWVLGSVVVCASSAFADPPTSWDRVLHVSKDGARVGACHTNLETEEDLKQTWCDLHSVRSGESSSWATHPLRRYGDGSPPETFDPGRSRAAAWKALTSHFAMQPIDMEPLNAKDAVKSPDGELRVELVPRPQGDENEHLPWINRVQLVSPQGRTTVAVFEQVDESFRQTTSVGWKSGRVFVSDARYYNSWMRGTPVDDIVTSSQPLNASISIVVPSRFEATLGLQAERVLTRAGQGGWVVGSAQKARAKSALYFAEGERSRAEAIASLLPFGADIEPITWKSSTAVVFAPGMDLISGIKPKIAAAGKTTLEGMLGKQTVLTTQRDGGTVYQLSGTDAFWDGPDDVLAAAALAPMSAFEAQKASPHTPYVPCAGRPLPPERPARLGGALQTVSVQRQGYTAVVYIGKDVPEQMCVLSNGSFAAKSHGNGWTGKNQHVKVLLPATGTSESWQEEVIVGLNYGEVELGVAKKPRAKTIIYTRDEKDADLVRIALESGWTLEPLTWKTDAVMVIAVGEP